MKKKKLSKKKILKRMEMRKRLETDMPELENFIKMFLSPQYKWKKALPAQKKALPSMRKYKSDWRSVRCGVCIKFSLNSLKKRSSLNITDPAGGAPVLPP